MRYSASEKLEIIRTVETSHLPIRRTLDKIGIPKTTFYAWLDRYAAGGLEALEDLKPRPKRVWNRIPNEIRDRIIERALASRSSRHASWRSPSPMPRRPSSPRPASIASSRPRAS
jgi:transposase-like protein